MEVGVDRPTLERTPEPVGLRLQSVDARRRLGHRRLSRCQALAGVVDARRLCGDGLGQASFLRLHLRIARLGQVELGGNVLLLLAVVGLPRLQVVGESRRSHSQYERNRNECESDAREDQAFCLSAVGTA